MNSRRGFFSRLAAVVAAVAIAPEIAFRTRLELPEVEDGWPPQAKYYFSQNFRHSVCYDDAYYGWLKGRATNYEGYLDEVLNEVLNA